MMIARGLVMMVRVGFAIGCIVGGIMVFPIWYEVCETLVTMLEGIIWFGEEMDAITSLFLTVFPYLSIFFVGLAFYIGFSKLLNNATGESKDDL